MGRAPYLKGFALEGKGDMEKAMWAIDVTDLSKLYKRNIQELSGGERQRAFIARALAQEAELMLMDEPLTGLDVKSQEEIFTILDELRQRQVTIMVATHDLNLAAERFDRLMLLNEQMLGFGQANEVFTTELLSQAYSGHMRLLETPNGTMVLSDTCCGGGE
jgi:ABC-type cobalamin/Fe3+-siderophores transport system ATPase subunit